MRGTQGIPGFCKILSILIQRASSACGLRDDEPYVVPPELQGCHKLGLRGLTSEVDKENLATTESCFIMFRDVPI